MNRILCLTATALLAAGCATELRYSPLGPVREISTVRLSPIASIAFKDSSGGLRSEGTGLTLSCPFFSVFREAVSTQLGALKIATTPGLGAAVEIELTAAFVQRGTGLKADLTSAVKFALTARRGDGTACRQDVVGWATAKEGLASSPVAETLRRALAKAMDNLEPAIEASCLYASVGGIPVASAAPHDPKTWALIAAVGRSRDGSSVAPGAPQDALAAAEFARKTLGVPDDHVVVVVDNMATLADLQKYTGRWLADRVGPDGKVFFAFFGRGVAGATRGAALLPFDGDAEYPAETGLPLGRLYADLGRLPGRSEVLLGHGVNAARPPMLPANVRLFAADADPRAAFQAVQADWRSQ
jgi:hypothetical protein